mmetsp:Transcript_29519/g.42139  ORF Transcript_29519/g.42139 Transcript_29519/m.42139 type:complete len:222 (+) Transcript_29519:995-1660(+)
MTSSAVQSKGLFTSNRLISPSLSEVILPWSHLPPRPHQARPLHPLYPALRLHPLPLPPPLLLPHHHQSPRHPPPPSSPPLPAPLLAGKRLANCCLSKLPAAPGPWLWPRWPGPAPVPGVDLMRHRTTPPAGCSSWWERVQDLGLRMVCGGWRRAGRHWAERGSAAPAGSLALPRAAAASFPGPHGWTVDPAPLRRCCPHRPLPLPPRQHRARARSLRRRRH